MVACKGEEVTVQGISGPWVFQSDGEAPWLCEEESTQIGDGFQVVTEMGQSKMHSSHTLLIKRKSANIKEFWLNL